MSYTTQRDFFNVTFRNEEPKPPERKRSDGALMTYEFCTDGRAWALDKKKRSNYILDVVHKARFKKAMLHPEGQFELTRDYLVNMEVHDLADYILSLQAEVRRKNETVQQLDGRLQAVQQNSQDFDVIQRQSAILEQERSEFEQQISDLEEVIVSLKDRADRYDLLAKENNLLRCQLQKQQLEVTDKVRLANAEAEASFNRMRAKDCERLEAELVIFKAQYEDLRKQKRELKEQLEAAFINHDRVADLKRQLANEQAQREQAEEAMEHLLNLYDKQYQEMQHRSEFTSAARQRSESIRRDERINEEHLTERITYQADSQPLRSIEEDSCANCKRLEREIADLNQSHQKREKRNEEERQSLVNELQSLRQQMQSSSGLDESVEQARQLAEQLRKCQAELEAELANKKTLQNEFEVLENELSDVRAKLQEEGKKAEQLTADLTAAQNIIQELEQLNKTESAVLSADRGSANSQIEELQQQLKQVKKELSQKAELLEKMSVQNTQLQAAASDQQTKINNLEQAQQQKLAELEASESELQKARQEFIRQASDSGDSSALKALENFNSELQQQVNRLKQELDAAYASNKQLIENAGEQGKLMETVAALQAELQAANNTLEAKEAEISRLAEEVATVESVQLKTDAPTLDAHLLSTEPADESLRVEAALLTTVSDDVAKVDVPLVDSSLPSVRADNLLPSIDTSLKSAEAIDSASAGKTELDDTLQKNQTEIEDLQAKLSADQQRIFDFEQKDAGPEKDMTENEDEIIDQINQIITSEKDSPIADATLEDVDEKSVHSSGDEGDEESESTSEVEKETEDAAEARKLSITADEVINRLNESFAGIGDTVSLEYADPCRTKVIAMKIVKHGINILVLPELDHLHREIYRATLERYLMLGKTVQVLDDAFCDNCNILHTMQSMGNNELMAMIAPSAQVPASNPLLLDDEIPTRLPPEPAWKRKLPIPELNSTPAPEKQPEQKSRAKTADDAETRVFSLFTKGSAVPAGQHSVRAKKPDERLLIDRCRTLPWRAPRTPTEVVISSNLADGSQLVARQKRHM
ncbi:myosin heavy chain, striated muscle-like [Wyeomyia smithii]|uniref:myosin heavy chain, striated muscle-like n=1 Tax=Wyeomyia smithii TaxID=174621 RepID=UPI002467E11B|nr:myosin heavy chain, striated muscle-like [Wyeomyia smithii]